MNKETNKEPRRFRALPHPDDIAVRAALAKRPPLSLEQVLSQAKAAEEWRRKNAGAKASPMSVQIIRGAD